MVCIKSKNEPRSRYLADFVSLPAGKKYRTEGLLIVAEFLRKFRASGITCVNDRIAYWLNEQRDLLPPGIAVWLPSNDTIKNLLPKKNRIEAARKVGFNVLPTYFVGRVDKDFGSISPKHFPLCLRPAGVTTDNPTFKVQLAFSFEKLKKYFESLQKIEKPLIAQPFLNMPNLVIHGTRTNSGKTIGLQAFLVERKFKGVTLTIRPTNTDKDNGSIYFLELNTRFGGTTAKVYACGYDEPILRYRPMEHNA